MSINPFQASARRRVLHISLMNKSSPGQLWWTRPLLPVKPVELNAVVTPVNLLVMLITNINDGLHWIYFFVCVP